MIVLVFCSCNDLATTRLKECGKNAIVNVAFIDSVLNGSALLESNKILSFSSDNDDALIVDIDRILFADNRTFIIDRRGRNLLAFDAQGNFVASTARLRGDGPQGYLSLMDAAVDNKRKEVYVHCDSPYCILIFDLNLNLKEKVNLDYYMMEIADDENYIYGMHWKTSDSKGFELLALDKKDLKSPPVKIVECSHFVNGIMGMGKCLSSYDNGINVCLPFDNTIWQISNGRIVRSFEMDFGKKHIDYLKVGNVSGREFINIYGRNSIWWIKNICGSDDKLMFGSSGLGTFLLDIHTGKCKGYRSFHNDMFLYSTTNTIPVEGMGNAFAYVCSSMDVCNLKENVSEGVLSKLHPQIKGMVMNHKEEDNPLVVLCMMK